MSVEELDSEYYGIYQARSDGDWDLYMVYSKARIEDEPSALDFYTSDLDEWLVVEGGDCDFPSIHSTEPTSKLEPIEVKLPGKLFDVSLYAVVNAKFLSTGKITGVTFKKALKKVPDSYESGDAFVKVNLKIPEALFSKSIPEVTIAVPPPLDIAKTIEADGEARGAW